MTILTPARQQTRRTRALAIVMLAMVAPALLAGFALSTPAQQAKAASVEMANLAAPANVDGCRSFRERTIHADGRVEVTLFKACE